MSLDVPYRLGLIGLGRVAWLLEEDPLRGKPCSHLGAWLLRDDVLLVAACDLDPDRRRAFRRRFPHVTLYSDYSEMLSREALDMVSVAAYATERSEMVANAADAGVRGIWCEKAMATSLLEAERIEEALARNGTEMIVSFMRRWSPDYMAVKQMVDAGAIGRLESVNVHFSDNMLHTGTHAFDVLRMWCGDVQSVQAWLGPRTGDTPQSGYRFDKGEVRDTGGFALLDFTSGVRASVHGQSKGYFRFEFELLGSEGLIRIGNSQRELWCATDSNQLSGFRELQSMPFPTLANDNVWEEACSNLVGAIEGRSTPRCSVTDGREALAIALAAHESHRKGHRPVSVREVPMDLRVPSR